jgi:hypothetical protein
MHKQTCYTQSKQIRTSNTGHPGEVDPLENGKRSMKHSEGEWVMNEWDDRTNRWIMEVLGASTLQEGGEDGRSQTSELKKGGGTARKVNTWKKGWRRTTFRREQFHVFGIWKGYFHGNAIRDCCVGSNNSSIVILTVSLHGYNEGSLHSSGRGYKKGWRHSPSQLEPRCHTI